MNKGERFGREIAKAGLTINAIKLNPDKPFLWASGFSMPIYNDNRMFLWYPEYRDLIADGFHELMSEEELFWGGGEAYQFIAGTSTAGIPHAERLADKLVKPMVYVRDKPKDHGLRNQVEGIDAESDLQGMTGILIEDLISTGGSSARAVQAVRDANGVCNHCFSIFNYGLDKAVEAFDNLEPRCVVRSILTYDTLLEVAKATGYVNDAQVAMLEEWRADPFGWGEKHGFPKVER